MKHILITFIALISVSSLLAQIPEEQAVREVIEKSYVQGIHNNGEIPEIEQGFHPGFVLLGVNQNMLTLLPIYNWVESIRQRKASGSNSQVIPTECKYLTIDVTGGAAMAKIELYRENKLIFTDYLFLYKFEDGWKIVSKIYHRH